MYDDTLLDSKWTAAGDSAAEMDDKYLIFLAEGQLFGLPISNIISIIQIMEFTSMPDLPPYVKGIINLRGQVIPVISISLRFGKSEQPHTDRTCIVVLQLGESRVGFLVDGVDEVISIPPDDIAPCPSLAGASSAYVTGIGKLPDGKMILLLDSIALVGDDLLMLDGLSSQA